MPLSLILVSKLSSLVRAQNHLAAHPQSSQNLSLRTPKNGQRSSEDWDQGRVIPKIATNARSGCSVAIWPLFRFDASELDYLGSFVDFGGDEVLNWAGVIARGSTPSTTNFGCSLESTTPAPIAS